MKTHHTLAVSRQGAAFDERHLRKAALHVSQLDVGMSEAERIAGAILERRAPKAERPPPTISKFSWET